jgi:hypothetical protein
MHPVNVVVEGDTDLPVARAILKHVGLEPGLEIDCGGKARLDQRLPGYSAAAAHSPWLVLRDLDTDAACAAALVHRLVPRPARRLCLRIAVHAVEAWLLADADRMAQFLHVQPAQVPAAPDDLRDPKQALVNLARRSTRPAIREDMVPGRKASRPVGPGYEARIIEFASKHWRPARASARSPSLHRCIDALRGLARAPAR